MLIDVRSLIPASPNNITMAFDEFISNEPILFEPFEIVLSYNPLLTLFTTPLAFIKFFNVLLPESIFDDCDDKRFFVSSWFELITSFKLVYSDTISLLSVRHKKRKISGALDIPGFQRS